MKVTTILLYLAATALGAEQSPTPTHMDNKASLSSALYDSIPSSCIEFHLTPSRANLNSTTATVNFASIAAPPKNMIPELLSVMPITVLWELIVPASRSSIESQFDAGSTPAWYTRLPSNIKSYMSVVKSQIDAGKLTATPASASATATGASASGSATAASSTSSGLAVQTSPALGVSVLGALGVIGVALVL